jgi:histidinol-phosphate aminotransferase
VWFDLPAGPDDEPADVEREVLQGLTQRGILVRAGGSLGRAGALRVTVGTEAENERFLDALGALLD